VGARFSIALQMVACRNAPRFEDGCGNGRSRVGHGFSSDFLGLFFEEDIVLRIPDIGIKPLGDSCDNIRTA